jgi:hypothetical protein
MDPGLTTLGRRAPQSKIKNQNSKMLPTSDSLLQMSVQPRIASGGDTRIRGYPNLSEVKIKTGLPAQEPSSHPAYAYPIQVNETKPDQIKP